MDESEWRTRKQRIDTRLSQCNPPWHLLPWKPGLDLLALRSHAVTEFPTAMGLPITPFSLTGNSSAFSKPRKFPLAEREWCRVAAADRWADLSIPESL